MAAKDAKASKGSKGAKPVMAGDDLGRNAFARIEGAKLIIEVDLTKKGKRSKKGEGPNVVLGSTGGNQALTDKARDRVLKIGMNVYTPYEDEDE